MNGYHRIAAALGGRRPDRTPVMLHNFLMAAREARVTMKEYRENPETVVRVFGEAVEKYGYDGILVDIDTSTLAGAVGVPVEFPDDMPAPLAGRRLERLDDVRELPPPDVEKYPGIHVWLEATQLLARKYGSDFFIRGNCDQAPFSLACAMRGTADWLMDLSDPANHELAHELLDYCTEATTQFLRLMGETGAHMVSNGDSPAGPELASPKLYREFALPYERRVAACAHELGLPYMLHICGKTDRILAEMIFTGADALELDYKTDAGLAHRLMKDRTTFVGNIDPSGVLALGTPALVEQKTRGLLALFSDTPRFILNAGCAIPAETPAENLKTMIRVAREFGG